MCQSLGALITAEALSIVAMDARDGGEARQLLAVDCEAVQRSLALADFEGGETELGACHGLPLCRREHRIGRFLEGVVEASREDMEIVETAPLVALRAPKED